MRVNLGENKVLHVDLNGKVYVRLASQVQNEEGQALEYAHIAVYEIRKDTNESLIAELNTDMIGEASFDVIFHIMDETRKNLRFKLLNKGELSNEICNLNVQLDFENSLVQAAIDNKQAEEMETKARKMLEENEERIRRSISSNHFDNNFQVGTVLHQKGWVVINLTGEIISDEFAEIGRFDSGGIAEAKLLGTNIEVKIDTRGLIVGDNIGCILSKEEVIRKKRDEEAEREKIEREKQEENIRRKREEVKIRRKREEKISKKREKEERAKNITRAVADKTFHEEIGIGWVHTEGGWNVIDSQGKILKAEDMGLIFGCKGQANAEWLHWSFINNMFQIKLGVGRVMHTDGWTLINIKGDIITREVYEKIEAFDEKKGTARAKPATRSYHVLLNVQGQIVDERTGAPAANDYLDESRIKIDIADEQFKYEYTLPAIALLVERLFLQRLDNSRSVSSATYFKPGYIDILLFGYDFQQEVERWESYNVGEFLRKIKERVRSMPEGKEENSGSYFARGMNIDNWRNRVFGISTEINFNEDELNILDEFFCKLERCNYSCNPRGGRMAVSFVYLLVEFKNCFSKIDEAEIPSVREDFLRLYKMDATRCYGDYASFDADQMKYDEDYSRTENLEGKKVDLSTVKEFVKQSPRLSYEVFIDDRSIGCMDAEKGHDHIFFLNDELKKQHHIEVRIAEKGGAVATVYSAYVTNCPIVKFY